MIAWMHRPLFDLRSTFNNPVTVGITLGAVLMLSLTPWLIGKLVLRGRITPVHRDELMRRYRSWLVLAPLILVPILAGPAPTIAAVALLSLLCYREFARATGVFREKRVSLLIVAGILAVTYAVAAQWYRMFISLPALFMALLAACEVLRDQPRQYIQRVAMGVFTFVLFGYCLGHLSYFVNGERYRPILLMLVLAVELNDVFAYVSGKSLGRAKLLPNTSPNKTVAGALGALVLTTGLVAGLGHFVFAGTPLAHGRHLLILGIMISLLGQMGDLVVSSIKRDIGIKDMGVTFPGHGGLLDRFDSLLLVSPAVFYYVNYFVGVGMKPGCESAF